MNIEIITAPLIGAAIGLITNGIAIKMMFRPWKAIYIGKFKVPFTPGLIPKEQSRIAKAVGKVVGNNLLDNDTIMKNLLSDTTKERVFSILDEKTAALSDSTQTLAEFLDSKNLLDKIDEKEKSAKYTVSDAISQKLISSGVGASMVDFASEELVKNANPMIAGIASKAISSARDSIIKKIEEMIREKAPDILADIIDKEYCKFKDKPVSEFINYITEKFPDYKEQLWNIICSFADKKLGSALSSFNIEGIVEQKINDFDLPELEKLIMSIAKKELHALVALGGILGLLMGFLNLIVS